MFLFLSIDTPEMLLKGKEHFTNIYITWKVILVESNSLRKYTIYNQTKRRFSYVYRKFAIKKIICLVQTFSMDTHDI